MSPCQRPPYRAFTVLNGQARSSTTSNRDTIPRSIMLSEASSLSSLSHGSLADTYAPEPTARSATSASPASTEELFKLFMWTYMDTVKYQAKFQASIQVITPLVEPKEQPLKARFPDLYFGKSHLDCIWFYQQCKDHLNTARTHGDNRIWFAASFLRDGISTC